jgi:hypothetical protein
MRNLFMLITILFVLSSCGGEAMPQHSRSDASFIDTEDTESFSDSGSSEETDSGTAYEQLNWSCIICQ